MDPRTREGRELSVGAISEADDRTPGLTEVHGVLLVWHIGCCGCSTRGRGSVETVVGAEEVPSALAWDSRRGGRCGWLARTRCCWRGRMW